MDKYIEMVLALPGDFFKDWIWKDGDQFIRKPPGENDFVDIQFIGDRSYWDYMKTIYYTINEGDPVDGELRPIPNQTQLQEIILLHFLKSDETAKIYDVINFFCDWFKAEFCTSSKYIEVENDSGVEIWLRYTMHIIYNQTWNCGKWVENRT